MDKLFYFKRAFVIVRDTGHIQFSSLPTEQEPGFSADLLEPGSDDALYIETDTHLILYWPHGEIEVVPNQISADVLTWLKRNKFLSTMKRVAYVNKRRVGANWSQSIDEKESRASRSVIIFGPAAVGKSSSLGEIAKASSLGVLPKISVVDLEAFHSYDRAIILRYLRNGEHNCVIGGNGFPVDDVPSGVLKLALLPDRDEYVSLYKVKMPRGVGHDQYHQLEGALKVYDAYLNDSRLQRVKSTSDLIDVLREYFGSSTDIAHRLQSHRRYENCISCGDIVTVKNPLLQDSQKYIRGHFHIPVQDHWGWKSVAIICTSCLGISPDKEEQLASATKDFFAESSITDKPVNKNYGLPALRKVLPALEKEIVDYLSSFKYSIIDSKPEGKS